jgi:phosphatidate cytidylyltransferase
MTADAFALAPYVAGALSAGGVGVAISRRRELIQRWCTWAVTAPLVGGSLALGAPGAVGLAAGLGVVAAYEYARLVRLSRIDRGVLTAVLVAAPLLAWLAPGALGRLIPVAAVLGVLPVVLSGDVGGGARRAGLLTWGGLWLGALAWLVPFAGGTALALFAAVSVADVAAWCGGKALRGPRLSPLSPGKTWSGLITGATAGVGVLALAHAVHPALVVAVTVAGPVGDLVESAVKRAAGVKDAGAWLPGFGGLLDRIDSLLVALAVAGALR